MMVSGVFYVVACWGGGSTERERKRLGKEAQLCPGQPLDSIEKVGVR